MLSSYLLPRTSSRIVSDEDLKSQVRPFQSPNACQCCGQSVRPIMRRNHDRDQAGYELTRCSDNQVRRIVLAADWYVSGALVAGMPPAVLNGVGRFASKPTGNRTQAVELVPRDDSEKDRQGGEYDHSGRNLEE